MKSVVGTRKRNLKSLQKSRQVFINVGVGMLNWLMKHTLQSFLGDATDYCNFSNGIAFIIHQNTHFIHQ